MIRVAVAPSFEAFRRAARPLLERRTSPDEITWEEAGAAQRGLFGADASEADVEKADGASTPKAVRVPKAYTDLAGLACAHRDGRRFDVLYRIALRLTQGEPYLLELSSDPDVRSLQHMASAVRRDIHRVHAFVRFRRLEGEGGEHFVAWHRPDHRCLYLAAPFFAERFANMRWSIVTPDESAHWSGSGGTLQMAEGAPRHAAPSDDAMEELFRTYYRAIFNPARLNLAAQRSEMPKKHWSTMPEARLVPELVRAAGSEVEAMHRPAPGAAAAWLPEHRSLEQLMQAARDCRGCGLCERATQTVFGEGPSRASIVLVGEQPGDEEDKAGRPFVGPASRVLDAALVAAGLIRAELYLTNAVKHFKWEPRGKRRLHARPSAEEVQACQPWVAAEIEALAPRVVVCMGNTAAQSLLGRRFPVATSRGRAMSTRWAPTTIVTYHPSAVLRAGGAAESDAIREALTRDLVLARLAIADSATSSDAPVHTPD